jgi:hypothetical protein
LAAEIDSLAAERAAIKSTLSWRITKPIRFIRRMLSKSK